MSDNSHLRSKLTAAADQILVHPPPTGRELEELARGLQQRRRRRIVAVAAAVVMPAVAIGAVWLASGNAGPEGAPVGQTPQSPTAPQGRTLIGMGGVVVAVPDTWIVAENGCARPTGVIFRYPDRESEWPSDANCPKFPDGGDWAAIAVGRLSSPSGEKLVDSSWVRTRRVSGIEVNESSFQYPEPALCGVGDVASQQDCDVLFWAPSTDTFFRLHVRGENAKAEVDAIRDSLQLLP